MGCGKRGGLVGGSVCLHAESAAFLRSCSTVRGGPTAPAPSGRLPGETLHARPAVDAAAPAAATSTTVRERRGARTWERAEERRGRSHGAIACPNSESSASAPARTRRGRRSSCVPRIRYPRAFAILVRPSLSPVVLEPSPVSTCMRATTSAHTHEQVRPVDRAEPVRLLSHN